MVLKFQHTTRYTCSSHTVGLNLYNCFNYMNKYIIGICEMSQPYKAGGVYIPGLYTVCIEQL